MEVQYAPRHVKILVDMLSRQVNYILAGRMVPLLSDKHTIWHTVDTLVSDYYSAL